MKKKYFTFFLTLLLFLNCNINETEKKFYNNLLSDGEMQVKWREERGDGKHPIGMNFKFKNNKITDFSCNNSHFYGHTSVANLDMDTRFTIIDEVGSTLKLKTPMNSSSFGAPDWDIKLEIAIDDLGTLKGRTNTLKGSVTIIQTVPDADDLSKAHESSQTCDATFTVTVNNFTGEDKTYYENGKIESIKNYKNGILNGICKEYYSNEQLKSDLVYREGKPDGNQKIFFENGKIESEANYIDGKVDGLAKTFFENGEKRQEVNYAKGLQDGFYIEYFQNGKLYKKLPMKSDKADGNAELYYDNGNLHASVNFTNGTNNGGVYYDYNHKLKSENGKAYRCKDNNCSLDTNLRGERNSIHTSWRKILSQTDIISMDNLRQGGLEDSPDRELKIDGYIKFIRNFTDDGKDSVNVSFLLDLAGPWECTDVKFITSSGNEIKCSITKEIIQDKFMEKQFPYSFTASSRKSERLLGLFATGDIRPLA